LKTYVDMKYCMNLKKYNIVITGGNKVKRHMLSVIKHKLALWLLVIDGMDCNKTRDSFKFEPKEFCKIKNDFTNKKICREKIKKRK